MWKTEILGTDFCVRPLFYGGGTFFVRSKILGGGLFPGLPEKGGGLYATPTEKGGGLFHGVPVKGGGLRAL